MRPKFLQASHDNLGQMALVVTVGDLDGFVQLAFAQRAGHGRSELARLLAGAVIGDQAIDHHADRPCRHEEQQDDHESGRPAHLSHMLAKVEIDTGAFLQKHERPYLQL